MPIDGLQDITRRYRTASRRIARNKTVEKASARFREFLQDMLEDQKNERIRKEEEAQRKAELAQQQANFDAKLDLAKKEFEAKRRDVADEKTKEFEDNLRKMQLQQEGARMAREKMPEYGKAYDALIQEPTIQSYTQARKIEAEILSLDPTAIPNPVSEDKIFQEYLKPKDPTEAQLKRIQERQQALDVNTAISELTQHYQQGGWPAASQYYLSLSETKPNVAPDPRFKKVMDELQGMGPSENQLSLQTKAIKAYAAQNWAMMIPDVIDGILRENGWSKKDYMRNDDIHREVGILLEDRRQAYLSGVEAQASDLSQGGDGLMSLEDRFKRNAAIIQELKEEIYGRGPGVPFR